MERGDNEGEPSDSIGFTSYLNCDDSVHEMHLSII